MVRGEKGMNAIAMTSINTWKEIRRVGDWTSNPPDPRGGTKKDHNYNLMGENQTVVSAYIMYRHLTTVLLSPIDIIIQTNIKETSMAVNRLSNQGLYSPTISTNVARLFFENLVNLKVIQLLTG